MRKNKFEKLAAMEVNVIYPNPEDWDDNFGPHNYLIPLGAIGTSYFAVNAGCEQDAIDYIIDYCEEKLPGLIMSEDEEIDEREFIDEYIQGGNCGLYLNIPAHEMRIETL